MARDAEQDALDALTGWDGGSGPVPDTWRSALRGLRDNPLARYLPLMHRRQAQRTARRSLPWRIVFTLAALTGLYFFVRHSLGSAGIARAEQTLITTAVIVVPAFAVLYFRGLFAAFQACLNAPNRRRGAQRAGLIEELTSATQLKDRELILGLGRIILPVLFKRVLAAAVLIQALMLVIAYEESGVARLGPAPGSPGLLAADLAAAQARWTDSWHALLAYAPLTLACTVAAGMLASVCCCLWLFCMGRRRASQATIAVEAALAALFQMLGALFCLLLHVQFGYMRYVLEIGINFETAGVVAGGLAAASAAIAGLPWLAQRASWLRHALPALWPALLATSAVLLFADGAVFSNSPGYTAAGAAAVLWSSALCLGNALANPVYVASLEQPSPAYIDVMLNWWPLVLIMFQLVLIPALARQAIDSLRRYRRGE